MEATERTPYYVDEEGLLRFRYHPGQRRAVFSEKRFAVVIAGTQSGKTVTGPWWLFKEIKKRDPGDYLVAAPTFQLMKKKVLPEFKKLFETRLQLGSYHESDKIFTFSTEGQRQVHGAAGETPTKVFFGHAQDPDSLESATAKAAWLDEAGQKKFKYGSWEAIQRRLSIYQGRVFITTTPYYVGWLKHEVVDDPGEDTEVIHFQSTHNPAFPEEEFERQKKELPAWKFNMMYRGRFERPAGMIYDVWDREAHCIPRFSIPEDWPRYLGLDFGGVNTAGVFLTNDPGTKRYILYRAYHEGGRTAKEHAAALLQGEPAIPKDVRGGSSSEGQWRHEFRDGGLPVKEPPISNVEVGINRVYAMLKATAEERYSDSHLVVMSDCTDVIDEIESYQRELDDQDQPTEKIEDKSEYHLCFSASTLVTTAEGVKPICDIDLGEKVLTRFGWRPVLASRQTHPNTKVVEIHLSNGEKLVVTPEHPVYVIGKGYIEAHQVEKYDKLLSESIWQAEKQSPTTGSATTDTQSQTTALTGSTTSPKEALRKRKMSDSTGKSGLMKTALSQRGLSFITKMGPHLITTLKTWFASPSRSISMSTRTTETLKPCDKTYCRMQFPGQRSGTGAKKGGSGIASIPRGCGRKGRKRSSPVSTAGSHTGQKIGATTSTAQTPVRQRPDAHQGSTMKRGSVSSAGVTTPPTNTARGNTAQVIVERVHERNDRVPVYNLEVDSPVGEFFANGVLVHNCDGLRYIASAIKKGAGIEEATPIRGNFH